MTTTTKAYPGPAIVLFYANRVDDPTVYGPFASGDDANSYGFKNCEGKGEWHWLPLTSPSTET